MGIVSASAGLRAAEGDADKHVGWQAMIESRKGLRTASEHGQSGMDTEMTVFATLPSLYAVDLHISLTAANLETEPPTDMEFCSDALITRVHSWNRPAAQQSDLSTLGPSSSYSVNHCRRSLDSVALTAARVCCSVMCMQRRDIECRRPYRCE